MSHHQLPRTAPLGGTYNTAQSVTLTANEAAAIYYTTNGSIPTTSSTQYSAAIPISATTTLKYFAKDTAGNSEAVKTQTYTITVASTPQFVAKWGSSGTGNGQFTTPRGTELDLSGNVIVADSGNNRIQKFTNTGTFMTKWGSSGSTDGKFNNPTGIAVDASGNIYIADSGNNRIQKFTSARISTEASGSSGSTGGKFNNPTGIAIDSSGNVYVS